MVRTCTVRRASLTRCPLGRACRQGRRTRVSARAAAWIQHTSCTHPIAGCGDRSRIVGRQRYSGRRPYQVSARLYQECQAVSWSRAHWCSKTKAMPDRQRQGFFSRVPKKLSKQGFPRLRQASRSNGGHVVSIPGAKNLRIEVPSGSSLPAKLIPWALGVLCPVGRELLYARLHKKVHSRITVISS